IGNGVMQLETLLEPLLGLCNVNNVVVVSNSLRVLKVFLKHLLTLKNKAGERYPIDVFVLDGHPLRVATIVTFDNI
ncbi:hypothetical protein CUMW_205660, partial [Citrus unshiu]